MKLHLNEDNVVGSTKRLNKLSYAKDEPIDYKCEMPLQPMTLNSGELKELKKFLQFCKKEKIYSLEFKTTARALTIIGNNLETDHEVEIRFDLREEGSEETSKYSTDYLLKILGSFKTREINNYSWGYTTDAPLYFKINENNIALAPRIDTE